MIKSQTDNNQEYVLSQEDSYIDSQVIYRGTETCPIYTKHHAIPRTNEKTIRHDLEKLGLPPDIINDADEIHRNMSLGTKRGKKRKMLLFFCAFTAYYNRGIAIDPTWLANLCELSRSCISKAMSMCSSVNTNYDVPLMKHHPSEFVEGYFNSMKGNIEFPDSALDDIYEIIEEVMEKDEELHEQKPQSVAAAVFVMYLWNNGYTIEKSQYKPIFGHSDMTINKIKKMVFKAYNE